MTDDWEGESQPFDGKPDGKGGRQRSVSSRLIDAGLEVERWHWDGEAFATVTVGDHHETHAIRSRAFRGWLAANYFADTRAAPKSQALEDAVRLIDIATLQNAPARKPWIRVAEADGRIYVDLCNDAWEVVEIGSGGWRVIPAAVAPVRFVRTRGMRSLVRPEEGGSLLELRRFVNVADQDLPLLLGVLVAAFRPAGPYPVLCITGEQGTAKTTAARVIKRLIDPNVAPARALPREERDLLVAARNSWLLSFDNLSGFEDWLSDAFCRISTGGGFGARALHTDMDETIFEAQRPILLNGIADLTRRADLADRAVALSLPRIDPGTRKLESVFWREFEEECPFLLGALFGAVAVALSRFDQLELHELPRLADFARWAVAAEPAFGTPPGAFLEAYQSNIAGLQQITIEDDLVATGVRDLAIDVADGRVRPPDGVDCPQGTWAGSATQLLGTVKATLGTVAEGKRFPQTPSAFSARLRRVAPALRSIGVLVDQWRSHGVRQISVRRDV
jgi:hypothetical protein